MAARSESALPAGLRAALRQRVGIDTRALAAFRIAVGAILVSDLWHRARDLVAFYTDAGVLPREASATVYPTLSTYSIHGLSGGARVQWLLFGLAAVLAVLLVVGYRTRAAAVGSWLLLASLQFRNYLVLNGGDTVLLVALFVALFLPLGERWSLDALAADGDERRPRVVGFGTAALLSQVVLIYATNAVFKLRSDAWTSGTAIPTVYRVDRFTVLLEEYLAGFPGLLSAANYAWLGLLAASPLLLVARSRGRTVLVGAFAVGHVGMYLTLDLGFFPHVMLACLLLFLPAGVWDHVEAALVRLDRSGSRRLDAPTILVVGLLWQGVALGYVSAPSATPVDPAEHSWKLFAPHPPTNDGWFVVNGTLASGASVDLYPHADTLETPPDDAATTYPTTRWRKYLSAVRRDEKVRRYFADYLCRWGHDRYGAPVDSLTIAYVRAPATSPTDTARSDFGRYRCPVVD
ncbi:HTTM domain-containing protein [Halobacteriales archaeon SW_12_69_24]|nr:MAG: HTTM domain-containing protein [Halobacteriales archaeon SW_12_69_24]